MDKKLNVLILVTSAPHFPVDRAKQSYAECLDLLKSTYGHLYNFIEYREVITDTVSREDDLESLKKQCPDMLVLIQGAFTWDNITAYLHQYFMKPPLILWAVPDGIFDNGVLGTNSLCGVIMNNAALHKLGTECLYCFGSASDNRTREKVADALAVAACTIRMKRGRYGMIGYRPTGFYNSTFDEIKVRKVLGIETIYYDLAGLLNDMEQIPEEQIKIDVDEVRTLGSQGEATDGSLSAGSKVYLTIKEFVQREKIDFLGVQCWPELMKRGLNPCMVLGRMIEEKIPAGCESDFFGALSMAASSWISGGTSWLADLIDINEKNNSFYLWHCGAAPASLADKSEKPVINKQFRGSDRCNTLEFALKEGDVTIVRFGISDDRIRIFAFEGKAINPDIKIRGNISEIIPDADPHHIMDHIIENGIEHHFAVIYGRYADRFKDLARLLKIDFLSP